MWPMILANSGRPLVLDGTNMVSDNPATVPTNDLTGIPMPHLAVRRLLVDLQTPFDRRWCDGDAFRSALFNALSMSFPVGEQFFIDSVRRGAKALPADEQARFGDEVQGFIGQEATHRRLHALFNEQLRQQGLQNDWEPRARERLAPLQDADVRHWLAITAANEHFTALLADWLLDHPDLFARTESRLATMWRWHSAEEAEHRSTAFDLYRALGGSHAWRVRWFRRVTLIFVTDLCRQTFANLKRDGALYRPATWRSAASLLFGRHGLVSSTLRPWVRYLRRDFHPSQHPDAAARRWLLEHADSYAVVGEHG